MRGISSDGVLELERSAANLSGYTVRDVTSPCGPGPMITAAGDDWKKTLGELLALQRVVNGYLVPNGPFGSNPVAPTLRLTVDGKVGPCTTTSVRNITTHMQSRGFNLEFDHPDTATDIGDNLRPLVEAIARGGGVRADYSVPDTATAPTTDSGAGIVRPRSMFSGRNVAIAAVVGIGLLWWLSSSGSSGGGFSGFEDT